MNKQQQRFNQRFPSGRDSWKFATRTRHGGFIGEELDALPPTYPYTAVEVPAEIVELIYKLGWSDAMQTAKAVLTEGEE